MSLSVCPVGWIDHRKANCHSSNGALLNLDQIHFCPGLLIVVRLYYSNCQFFLCNICAYCWDGMHLVCMETYGQRHSCMPALMPGTHCQNICDKLLQLTCSTALWKRFSLYRYHIQRFRDILFNGLHTFTHLITYLHAQWCEWNSWSF